MTDDFSHLPPEWAQVCRALEPFARLSERCDEHPGNCLFCIQYEDIFRAQDALAAARQHRPATGDMETAREVVSRHTNHRGMVNANARTLEREFAAALAGEREKERDELVDNLPEFDAGLLVSPYKLQSNEYWHDHIRSYLDQAYDFYVNAIRALDADETAPGTAKPGA